MEGLRASLAVVGGLALALAAALALGGGAAWTLPLAGASVLAAAAAAALTAGWRSIRSSSPWAWRLLAVGLALFAAAEAYWLWASLDGPVPAASPADAVYYAGYAFLLGAPLALLPQRATWGARVRRLTDALTVSAAVLAILWVALIDPAADRAGLSEAEAIVIGAYPALDVALASLLLVLAGDLGRGPRDRIVLLTVGLAAWAVADLAYAMQTLGDAYHLGVPLDALWVAGYLAFAAASLLRLERSEPRPRPVSLASGILVYLPVAVLLPFAVLDYVRHGGEMDPTLFTLGITMVALLAFRQALLTFDLVRGNQRLRAQQTMLEEAQAMAKLGAWDFDVVADRALLSTEAWRLWGFSGPPEPTTVADFHARVHPEDRPQVEAALQESLRNGRDYDVEVRILHPAGERVAHVRGRVVRQDAQGRPVAMAGTAQDVTQRHAADAALRRSEAQFRTLADNFPDYISRFDRALRRVYVNPAVKAIWARMGAGDPTGRSLDQAAVSADRERDELVRSMRASLADGQTRALRQAVATPDGVRILEGTIVPERDVDGRIESLLTVARDVTDRDAADRRLHASEERFRLATLATRDVIWDLDVATGRLEHSEAMQAVFGHDPARVGSTLEDWGRFVHPEDVQAITDQYVAVLEGRSAEFANEYRFRHADGDYRTVVNRALIVRGADGRPSRLVGAMQDVTEERRLLAALREGEERMRSLLDHLDEVYVSTDLATGRATNSAAVERVFGHPRPRYDAEPMLWSTQLHPEDRQRVLGRYGDLLKGTPTVDEARIVRPDGKTRWIRASMRPVRDSSGKVARIDGVIRDITAEREAEEQRQAVARLQEVAAFKTQFLNSAAHELATPLTPIKLQLASLRGSIFGTMTPQQQEALALLERNLDRLALLVHDLLDAARLQGGRLRVASNPTALAPLANDVVRSFAAKAAKDGITLSTRGLGASATVLGDEARLNQVLVNIVDNALKFTPRGGHVEVSLAAEAGDAVLAVTDSGMGLGPEQIARLFQPFSQVHDAARHPLGGTGLGLYISSSIVQHLGGRIACSSEGPGRGCRFEVRLPLLAATANAAGAAAAPA